MHNRGVLNRLRKICCLSLISLSSVAAQDLRNGDEKAPVPYPKSQCCERTMPTVIGGEEEVYFYLPYNYQL